MAELSAQPPLTPNLHDSSPLGTLIRTSSRRAKNQKPSNLELTPPRQTVAQAPHSPILHTAFRNSTATGISVYDDDASMRTISWDARSATTTSASTVRGRPGAHESFASNYSDIESITNRYRDTWRSSAVDPSLSNIDSPIVPDLPTVVVSVAPETPPEYAYDIPGPSKGGRVPSRTNNISTSFYRPSIQPVTEISPDEAEERKREVLMRNARHGHPHSPSPLHSPSQTSLHSPRHGPSPLNSPAHPVSPGQPSPGAGPGSRPISPSYNYNDHKHNHQPPPANPYPSPLQSPNADPSQQSFAGQGQIPKPGLSPRVDSSVSVYSNYSYYELPPTPTSASANGQSSPRPSPLSAPPHIPNAPSGQPTVPATPSTPASPGTPGGRNRAKSNASRHKEDETHPHAANPQTPQDYMQLGIKYHLDNKLAESAAAFEKSATLNGGCGVGMLMWGLAQRHGWGCEKNEATGFKWLRRAAELAVADLEKGQHGDMSAVRVSL